MKLTDKQLKNYIARMYRLLDKHSDKLQFKKLRKNQGYYVTGKDGSWYIEIDHREQMFSTLWHECLHHWHPTWKHKDIFKMETAIMNKLSERQVKNILKKLGKCL